MSDNPMPLTGHLAELRDRLVRAIIILSIGFAFCYYFRETLFELLKMPMNYRIQLSFSNPFASFIKRETPYNLYFTTPAEAFWMYMKAALIAGAIVTFPLILWQIWQFIAPALRDKEKKLAFLFVGTATAMFYMGLLFCFFFILPFAMEFLLGFTEKLIPMITVGSYVDFCLKFFIAFGVIFELPVIIVILTRMGIVSPRWLASKRPHAAVAAFIIAAFLTPTPDAFNQILMAVPIIILYESGIWASRLLWSEKKQDG
ncbi:MAG: twin-arginine translocase subunit TatC [Nitrospirae bacterium]|nr:twin-arginine translocase subunit TatC [Nitrospirota bacterium]